MKVALYKPVEREACPLQRVIRQYKKEEAQSSILSLFFNDMQFGITIPLSEWLP